MSIAGLSPARVAPGLLVALLGSLLLLDNLDIWHAGDLRDLWPMLVIAFGLQSAAVPKNRRFGWAVAGAGCVLLLATLGLVDLRFRDVWRFWPLILIAAGLSMILRRGDRGNLAGGVVLLVLGSYFLGSNLGLITVSLRRLWPVAVIALGVSMALKALAGRSR